LPSSKPTNATSSLSLVPFFLSTTHSRTSATAYRDRYMFPSCSDWLQRSHLEPRCLSASVVFPSLISGWSAGLCGPAAGHSACFEPPSGGAPTSPCMSLSLAKTFQIPHCKTLMSAVFALIMC